MNQQKWVNINRRKKSWVKKANLFLYMLLEMKLDKINKKGNSVENKTKILIFSK